MHAWRRVVRRVDTYLNELIQVLHVRAHCQIRISYKQKSHKAHASVIALGVDVFHPRTVMTHTELAPTDGFALLSATASADTNEVRRLLSEVPPSMRAQLVNFADYDGRRPLHVACSLGHTAVARELLRSGADWRCKDRFGRSCVHEAVASGRLPVLRALAAWNGDAARAVKHPVDVFGDGLPAACVEPSYCWGRDLLCAVATGNIRAVRQLVRQFGANGKPCVHACGVPCV